MRVTLTSGAYEARSIIADAQRCVNLYPEANPKDSPSPFTYYPTPGLTLRGEATQNYCRCTYRASNGNLYACYGTKIYSISHNYVFAELGTIGFGTTPVSMADNGTTVVIVDGTPNGYTITMATDAFGTISDPAFYGADRVDYIDTYFVFNKPGTPQWYISGSNAVTFDPLDFANKVGYPDNIVSLIVMHREVWLVGELTTEIWYNSGAADFTFQQMPGAYIEHGCVAKYSLAKQDLSVYWLSQDLQGNAMVLKGANYQVTRISTHALETAMQSYGAIADAVGFTYQQDGHVFYVLNFPTADKTWVYDEATQLWHERVWIDEDGTEHRMRAGTYALAYGKRFVGDWQNANLYTWETEVYTDNGDPIVRIRSFPHLMNDGNRAFYSRFIADMQVGTQEDPTEATPVVNLRWSVTRGASWSNRIPRSLGRAGQYLTSLLFPRIGMARDMVFELSWSAPVKTALNGCFVNVDPSES